MHFNITINGQKYQAKRGETILQVLRRNAIRVPTLCYLKELSPSGACRMCVVEDMQTNELVPACATVAHENLQIRTHSTRVLESRKMVVELLLASHPADCVYCVQNQHCELQKLASELAVIQRNIKDKPRELNRDLSAAALVFDHSKCILCGRCVRVCDEIQGIASLDFVRTNTCITIGTTFNKGLNMSNCIFCGQCTQVCPTGAIRERNELEDCSKALVNQKIHKVAITNQATALTTAAYVGLKNPGTAFFMLTGALKTIGFDAVISTDTAVDLYIVLISKLLQKERKSWISSRCPAIVKMVEQSFPQLIDRLIPFQSPEMLAGTLYAQKYNSQNPGNEAGQLLTFTFGACTAKKYERQRALQQGIPASKGKYLINKELLRLLQYFGLQPEFVRPENPDADSITSSAANKQIVFPDGMCQALIANLQLEGGESGGASGKVKQIKNEFGTEFLFSCSGRNYRLISIDGSMKAGIFFRNTNTEDYDFIEVNACIGSCNRGGGQLQEFDDKLRKNVNKWLLQAIKQDHIDVSGKNQQVKDILKNVENQNPDVTEAEQFKQVFSKIEVLR